MTTILIKNGTVVTATETMAADLLIDGEKVVALAAHGTQKWTADSVIDAKGKYVFPGGIDVHTHMELPFGGTYASDNFETGSRAAAFGGTTTIIDFAVQVKGGSAMEGYEAWRAKADGKVAIDYGLHMITGDINEQTLKEMGMLMDEGVTSFKLFTAYPGVFYSTDGEILLAMQKASEIGATVCMHAENGIAIDVYAQQALKRGETDPIYHALVRKSLLEGEAAHRVIVLAELTGAQLYIVHLSAKEALEEVKVARDRGLNVFAETCPQYLFFGLEEMGNGFEGAKYVCSPPMRDRLAGHQEALWKGLATNDLQVVSTDHCPFCMDQHPELGIQKRLGEGDFTKIPNGMPGVEPRFEVMYDGGVNGKRLNLNRFVEIIATTPAKMFGLYPKKGTIAPGSDADIVIFDPKKKHTISVKTQHMRVDYSAYEGKEIMGKVETVLSRGRVLIEGDKYLGKMGDGVYLRRGVSQYRV
jgi:dihydropyrimidinase